jgi:hypothetical protein
MLSRTLAFSIKSPRVYVADAGLTCHLLGTETAAELARSPFRGALFLNAS